MQCGIHCLHSCKFFLWPTSTKNGNFAAVAKSEVGLIYSCYTYDKEMRRGSSSHRYAQVMMQPYLNVPSTVAINKRQLGIMGIICILGIMGSWAK